MPPGRYPADAPEVSPIERPHPDQPVVVLLTSRGELRTIGTILLDIAGDLRPTGTPPDPPGVNLDSKLPPGSILQVYIAERRQLPKRQPQNRA